MNIINDILVDKCFPDSANARAIVPAYKEKTASGNPITLTDSAEQKPLGMKLYGWSKQDGTPSPDNPVEIESAGMRWSTGKNLFHVTKESDCNKANPTTTQRIILPGEYACGLTFTNLYAKCLDNVSISDRKISYSVTGIGYGVGVGVSVENGKKYAVSAKTKNGDIYAVFYDKFGTLISYTNIAGGYFKAPNDTQYAVLLFRKSVVTSANEEIVFEDIQLEESDIPTGYEPYTGGIPKPYGDKVVVGVRGKNLFHVQETNMKKAISWGAMAGTKITIVSNRNYSSIAIMDVLPNTTYFIKNFMPEKFSVTRVLEADENEIGYVNYKHSDNALIQRTITTSGNTTKMYLVVETVDGTTFTEDMLNDIEIMVAQSDVEESYEPYRTPQSTSVITPNGLPGIPVPAGTAGITYTDADGQAWIADEIDLERGKYVQRVWKGMFDGSENWLIYGNKPYQGFLVNALPEVISRYTGFCNSFNVETFAGTNEAVWFGVNNKVLFVKCCRFYDESLADKGLSNFKAHLAEHPLTVMTYLNTPIERDLTTAELAEYTQLYSYKPTTVVQNDSGCWMDLNYKAVTSGKSKNEALRWYFKNVQPLNEKEV